MLEILATGDYYAAIDDDCADPDLRDELARVCHQRLRRIDRFTQLCLIGSHRCVGDALLNPLLDPQTGLYLGSRFASISNTIGVHTQMIEHGHVPKPANFINTLSNSAGFYVGKNLQLDGKNLFVSRIDASTEAVFQIAQLDLYSQQVHTVLVGIVDEAPHPLSDHRRRLGVSPDTPLAEASHWFLIRRGSHSRTDDSKEEQRKVLARVSEVTTLADAGKMLSWLKVHTENPSEPCVLYYSAAGDRHHGDHEDQAERSLSALMDALPPYLATVISAGTDPQVMRYSPARTAGVISHFVQNPASAPALITIHRDSDQRFHVMRIQKQPE